MKIRCFCVVLLVSGTLCLHADRSYPGNFCSRNAQRPEQVSQEAALLGGFLFFR
ncbi:TPA: small toxic inner membrane protein TimP [Salmonella enterica subsp. diarizonae serovar 61:r:z53]